MNDLTTLAKISDLLALLNSDEQRRAVECLVLKPAHGESARAMAERYELKRDNKQIKCLIAVHYLSDYLPKMPYATKEELERVMPVAVEHVATFFYDVGWELPADLFNTISQAGTSGWIDSSSTTSLKTTEKGRSLLEDIHEPIYLETFKSRTIHASFIPEMNVTNPPTND